MKLKDSAVLFQVQDLGLIDYQRALILQRKFVDDVLDGGPQRLLLCEHHCVITLGRLADKKYILSSKNRLEKMGIIVHYVDRGGEVTLHAPGQLVVYPILNLNIHGRDLHAYMHRLEEVAIDLLGGFDIVANRFSGRTGVWIGERKIASIGIGVRKWISYHGLAVNINTDLDLYSLIRPCGLDVEMASVAAIKKRPIDMVSVKQRVIECFSEIFELHD